ncbi:MAG: 3-deoxy-manno-octulosonate cytidylyltransferase [Paramuribaculum sp.]|nr:3-deoxy-manno-octulosonate cytidylyltransferase [Paramuribaculum sp.]
MNIAAIIPARYASSRLPGKPLAMIGDMTMLHRTYLQVRKAVKNVWVATHDEIIADEVMRFGGRVIITSDCPRSGTERCAEAVSLLSDKPEIVINVQGDEPFISPADILALIRKLQSDSTCQIATLIHKFDPDHGLQTLLSPDNPKVIIDDKGKALYFSRAVIPFVRDYPVEQWYKHADFYMHTGTYAFRTDSLLQLATLQQSMLDSAESLEQLRWLSAGHPITTVLTDSYSISIDTPDDLDFANRLVKSMQ